MFESITLVVWIGSKPSEEVETGRGLEVAGHALLLLLDLLLLLLFTLLNLVQPNVNVN